MKLREGRLVLFILAPFLLVAMPTAATAATTVHVVERATTDAVTNGSEQDREGNVLTWHNRIYDTQNKHQMGRDAGYCVRIVVGKSWECSWTTYLKGGSISVQGPFSDTGNTVLAITGGTGAYAGLHGTWTSVEHRGGSATDRFTLAP